MLHDKMALHQTVRKHLTQEKTRQEVLAVFGAMQADQCHQNGSSTGNQAPMTYEMYSTGGRRFLHLDPRNRLARTSKAQSQTPELL
jgi:hypothetical protein